MTTTFFSAQFYQLAASAAPQRSAGNGGKLGEKGAAYYGDIDLNGQVDGDDLTVFAINFGRATGATQIDGDIDFDGTVDGEDLTVFANNFGKGIGSPLATGTVASVPEPAGLCLAGLAALIAFARMCIQRWRIPGADTDRY